MGGVGCDAQDPVVLDLKSGGLFDDHWVQVAAYLQLVREARRVGENALPMPKFVALLRLGKADGSFTHVEYPVDAPKIRAAWKLFLCLRRAYDLKREMEAIK